MKRIILLSALFLGIGINLADAQVSVNINIGSRNQPVWGPAGYDRAAYYYMPEMNVYYEIASRQFLYERNGRWHHVASLPARFRNYDLNRVYKVVINEDRPYLHNADHLRSYAIYRNRHDQRTIGQRSTSYAGYENRPVVIGRYDHDGGRQQYDNHANNGRSDRAYGYNRERGSDYSKRGR